MGVPEEQEDGGFFFDGLVVGFMEALVALGGAGPDLILHRLMHIVLGVALDDEEVRILALPKQI